MTTKQLLRLILLTTFISSCHSVPSSQPTQSKEVDVEGTVTGIVSNPDVRVFVLCQVRSAIWGGYDATVDLESAYTSDKKARSFRVKGGRFSVTVSDRNLSTSASRADVVRIGAREDAFAKGVPFFIDEVRFASPPDSLSFRVWSNPAMTIKNAAPRLQLAERRSESGYSTTVEIVISHPPIATQPDPRTITFQENRLDGWILSLVTTEHQGRCLVSNEVELASLLTK
jgi:hypothetical protein